MTYVDGYLVPVPSDRIEDYRRIADESAAVFREHGALAVVEAVADDVAMGEVTSFPRAVKQEEGETVVFSWILFESREHRDAVNAKIMEDPRMKEFDMSRIPFDPKRMIFGGFRTIVEK
jgi:uncharacterized protein YbaA (DUF1428 family)